MASEEDVWQTIEPDDIWMMDKLILSRKMGYLCGPVGQPVPQAGYYIVRPCVNALGLGLGASIELIKGDTDHLTPGHFWCEIFEGRHISVDYYWGLQGITVEGFKSPDTFTKWDKWVRVNDKIPLPKILTKAGMEYENINCEFIGGKLIEVHLRSNPDFRYNNNEFIPVWEGESTESLEGYQFVKDPEIHGRIGAFIK